jgi:hypothetical protein
MLSDIDERLVDLDMEDHQMISTNKLKVTILTHWMEIIGPCVDLVEQEGVLLAEIANHIVVLPIDMKEVLMPHLGCRIAILRTDIPGKEFLFRVLPDREKKAPMNENARVATICEASA